jgi:hypothetical protein
VPRAELACCRVECDGELMATRSGRAALRLLSELEAHVCRQLVHLHVIGNWCPTRRSGRVHVSASRHVVRFASWSETESARAHELLVVRGGDLSCEAETCQARRRLVGEGSSSRELVGEAPN